VTVSLIKTINARKKLVLYLIKDVLR
jgi:hypothetical protein